MGRVNFESFAFLLFAFPIMSGIVRPQCYMPERGLTMAILANSTNIQQIFNKYSTNIQQIFNKYNKYMPETGPTLATLANSTKNHI